MGYHPSGIKGYQILSLENKNLYNTTNISSWENIFPFKDDIFDKHMQNKDIIIPIMNLYDSVLISHDDSNKASHNDDRTSFARISKLRKDNENQSLVGTNPKDGLYTNQMHSLKTIS